MCAAAPRWLIFRLSGFVGKGLKKNVIFDAINRQKLWISPDSELQFINTKTAAQLMLDVLDKNIHSEIINLSAKGKIVISDIFSILGEAPVTGLGAPVIQYELNIEKLEKILERSVPTSYEEVERFLIDQRSE